jgi:hypothetical protein
MTPEIELQQRQNIPGWGLGKFFVDADIYKKYVEPRTFDWSLSYAPSIHYTFPSSEAATFERFHYGSPYLANRQFTATPDLNYLDNTQLDITGFEDEDDPATPFPDQYPSQTTSGQNAEEDKSWVCPHCNLAISKGQNHTVAWDSVRGVETRRHFHNSCWKAFQGPLL